MSWSFTAPPVPSLWKRWTPRFLAAGVDPIVIDELRAQIAEWDEWCVAWHEVAEETEHWAQRALDDGHHLTAGTHFTRASILYHYAGMVFLSDMDQVARSARRRVEAYARGAPLLQIPAQAVAVEAEGVAMPGYLRVPPAERPPPVVVLLPGWEGCKEEAGIAVDALLARGLATFTIDGPGIGETLEHLPMTGNYGPTVSAVIDVLQERYDVDGTRIALEGVSRGALLAARAAASEPRVAALAVIGPGYETRMLHWGPGMDELAAAYMQRLFHEESVQRVRERVDASDFSLEGVAACITCPTLVVTDDQESESQYRGSTRFYDELVANKELAVVSGAQRNGFRRVHFVRPMVADWLADQLGVNGRLRSAGV